MATNPNADEVIEGSAFDMLQFEAWAGLMSFLLKQDDARAQFEAETGTPPFRLPSNAIEAMIDKAAGYDPGRDYVARFVQWATPGHWGDETALTPSIQAVLAEKHS